VPRASDDLRAFQPGVATNETSKCTPVASECGSPKFIEERNGSIKADVVGELSAACRGCCAMTVGSAFFDIVVLVDRDRPSIRQAEYAAR
jgi:hypothetical protein